MKLGSRLDRLVLISFIFSAHADSLPANKWVPTYQGTDGTIAALTYLPEQRSFLYFGYPAPKSKNSDLHLYRPALGDWIEPLPGKGPHRQRGSLTTIFGADGRPGLPAVNRPYWLAHQSVFVPLLNKVLFFAGGSTFTYDPQGNRWENLDIPLDKSPPDVMLGTMAWDPVGQRVILFGGGYISAYKEPQPYIKSDMVRGKPWLPKDWTLEEKRATWAFDPASRTWSRIVTGSESFRNHFAYSNILNIELEKLSGSTRAIALEYSDKFANKSLEQLVSEVTDLASRFSSFSGRLSQGKGCLDDYEKRQCRLAAERMLGVDIRLQQTVQALSGRDGWKALHALEGARTIMLDVAEDLAPSPLPRYYGNLVTDTHNNLLVLFGGHGEDRILADTWVFDSMRNQWRQSQAKTHPPPHQMPAMSFDAEHGLVLLSSGWIYDAAKDEWRRIALEVPNNFLLPWKTLEYDPINKLHVLLTTDHNLSDKESSPLRIAHLRLEPRTAKAVDHAGRRWEWLDDKYERSWKNLPKTQAEYRARVQTHKTLLAKLPLNRWHRIKTPFRAENRSYGSFAYDPDREQLVFWGGGHSAYMGNQVSQYDIKGNLWMESWPAELPPWPFGSPDGAGWNPPFYHRVGAAHGYHKYAYNSQTGKIMFAFGNLIAYDSDQMRWDETPITKSGPGTLGNAVDMSGAEDFYTVSTQHWWGAPFGVWKLNPTNLSIDRIPRSEPPFSTNDRAKPVFDSRRNRILFYGAQAVAGKPPANQLYAFEIETGRWIRQEIAIASPDTQAPASMAWGISYSPKHDMVMILPGGQKQDTWLLDCATNTLKRFVPGPAAQGKDTNGVIYSESQDLFFTMEVGGSGPVDIHVMRLMPE